MKNIVSPNPPPPPPPPPASTFRKVLATLGLTQLVGTTFAQDSQPDSITPPAPPADDAATAESGGAPSARSAPSTTTAITTSTARAVEITPITSKAVPAASSHQISAVTHQSVRLPDTPNAKLEAVPKQKSKTALPQQHSLRVIKEPRSMHDASQSQLDVLSKVKRTDTKLFPLNTSDQSEAQVSQKEKPKAKDRKDKMETSSAKSKGEMSQ